MNTLRHRLLPVLLALVLSLGLAVPAFAAENEEEEEVSVTDVSLNKSEVTLSPGESVTLKATVKPSKATNKEVTWRSTKTSVATVNNGVVKAKSEGVTNIIVTTDDGSYSDKCTVIVEENYVTSLTISPAGPETLPVGSTRQLRAKVTYDHDSDSTQGVTWSSGDTSVAKVSSGGLVTAVAPGTTYIVAVTKDDGKDDSPLHATYSLTVTDAAQGNTDNDVLTLARNAQTVQAGLYQTITLTAPAATVVRDGKDVTKEYKLSWQWLNLQGSELSTEETASLLLPAQEEMTVTCNVFAANRNDSAKTPLRAYCRYTIQVLPGTVVQGATPLSGGPVRLDRLMSGDSGLSVIDQLVKGDGSQRTPAIPGLTEVVFQPELATGTAGSLNVDGTQHYGFTDAAALKLADVLFTPLAAGTYTIPFTAKGDQDYQGQLTVTVTAPKDPVAPAEGDRVCTSSGITFAGSDFFSLSDTDPVVSLVFGKPSQGALLRNMAFGSGVTDAGAKYYTDSAKDGTYHISTLSYLPPAGYAGQVTIPMRTTTRSGSVKDGNMLVLVRSKSTSEYFNDVTSATCGTWAANAVDFSYDNNLVSGMSQGLFSPSEVMTRAMLVTILYRAAGSPNVTATAAFQDLPADSYYYKAVVWASARGVVSGVSPTSFRPDAPVTREQIAVILHRYATLAGKAGSGAGANLDGYTDRSEISSYALKGMSWAVDRGIITGTSETTLSPTATATRAQVVVMLHRYLAT